MRFFWTQANTGGERGFNLVEIVVATGIISLSLVSVIAIAGRSIALSHRALNTYGAAVALSEAAEAVRSVRDNDWADIAALTPGATYFPLYDLSTNTWSLSTDPDDGAVGIYTRMVAMSDVSRSVTDDIDVAGTDDPGTKRFVATIFWREGTGATVTKTMTFYLSDIFSS